MPSDLTREDFRRWGRNGGLTGRKTPRLKCARCGAFVVGDRDCKRCKRQDASSPNPTGLRAGHLVDGTQHPVVGGINSEGTR